MALSSLDLLKNLPDLPSVGDATLQQVLDAADQAVRDYCHQEFTQTARTEFYSGSGQRDLVLRQRPVSAVSAVYVDPTGYYGDGANAFAAETLQTIGVDYVLVRDDGSTGASGLLRRTTQGWVGQPGGYGPWNGWYAGPLATDGSWVGWPRGEGNVKVQYTSGYATIPAAVVQAVNALAAWILRTPGATGHPLQGETLGRYSYQIANRALGMAPELGSVRQLLANYRELVV